MIAQMNEAQAGGAAVGFEGVAQAVSDHCAQDDASAKAKAASRQAKACCVTAPEVRTPDVPGRASADSRADGQIIGDDADGCQAFEKLAVRARQAGCRLLELAEGEFLLTHAKFGQPKACPDLRAAAAILDRLGAPA